MNAPASATPRIASQEHAFRAASGWFFLLVNLSLFAFALWLFIFGARVREGLPVLGGIACFIAAMIMLRGFFALQPNEAAVLILFGAYRGTARESGFFFTTLSTKNSKFRCVPAISTAKNSR